MAKGTQCDWGPTNRTTRLGDSIKSAATKPPAHTTSANGTRNMRSPRAMSGSPTTSQPTMKIRLPQIVQAETVPGPLMNAQKTKPETSQVAPKLFNDAVKRALRLVIKIQYKRWNPVRYSYSVYWTTDQDENCGHPLALASAQPVDFIDVAGISGIGLLNSSAPAGSLGTSRSRRIGS